jgi:hypothetical protein
VTFFEDTMTQVPGYLGRPYNWNADFCFAYPSITPNKRQDLGAVFNFAQAADWRPRVAYAMADDYHGHTVAPAPFAPPPWVWYSVRRSRSMPIDNDWGDYNTVREFEPTQKVWVAGAHRIPPDTPTPACDDCSVPLYMVFGRERDFFSWKRWRAK